MSRSSSNNTNNTVAVNKSQIVGELKGRMGKLPRDVVGVSVKTILDLIGKTLRDEGRVEIRGFGTFSVRKRKPRVARNPRTGETAYVGGKNVPHFKPGKRLRTLVNDRRATE